MELVDAEFRSNPSGGAFVVACHHDRGEARCLHGADCFRRILPEFVRERDRPEQTALAAHGDNGLSGLLELCDASPEWRDVDAVLLEVRRPPDQHPSPADASRYAVPRY